MNDPMPKRFGYVEADPLLGSASALPYAPITLQLGDHKAQVLGLIDSGATLNVLPFDVGLQLGAVWEAQNTPIRLGGSMAESEARGLIVTGQLEGLAPVRLAFAWSRSNQIPVILGQTNFFKEFDVRFCRSAMYFEVMPGRWP